MGRFAQAKRRGGGGRPSAANTNPITHVFANGSAEIAVRFARPIDVVELPPPGTFTIADQDAAAVVGIFPVTPNQVSLTMNGVCSPGDDWQLTDGGWTSPTGAAPASGLCE